MHNLQTSIQKLIVGGLIFALLLSGCNTDLSKNSVPSDVQVDTSLELDQYASSAEVSFSVTLPKLTLVDQKYSIEILDEVTGLGMNSFRYPLEKVNDTTYQVKLPFVLGSVVKYRYIREGNIPVVEYSALGKQVRYRLVYVDRPIQINDIVAVWGDLSAETPYGRITGQVINQESKSPLPDVFICAGGVQTLTASDGSFILAGLTPGIHNLVAYSLDGNYTIFQQEAKIAVNSTTPAFIEISPKKLVNITFKVSIPDSNLQGVPMRLIGNTYSLGNTFADLDGGLSTIASRAPLMVYQPDGTYEITLQLPSGFDLRYKYSLGDGLWNAEHKTNGEFAVRQFIIPDQDTVIEEHVESWSAGNNAPVSFTLTVPAYTPESDTISIQFNPYSWTEPITMWSLGENKWLYVLYSPLNMVGTVSYRFCRNDACGIGDDAQTIGNDAMGYQFTTSTSSQAMQNEITDWAYWAPLSDPTTLIAPEISKKSPSFIAGVELRDSLNLAWLPHESVGFSNIQSMGANMVVLTPNWYFTQIDSPLIEAVPGKSLLMADIYQQVNLAKNNQLNFAIYPQIGGSDAEINDFWNYANKDAGWWQSWFDRYETFIFNFADLAQQSGASALILGDDRITPALPQSTLMDGTSSGVPDDVATERWNTIIDGVRSRFSGQLFWNVAYSGKDAVLPAWIDNCDQIYLTWNAESSPTLSYTKDGLSSIFQSYFENGIIDIYQTTGKPIIVVAQFPSAVGAVTNCVSENGVCLNSADLELPGRDPTSVAVSLTEQLDLYDALLSTINQYDWVNGFISRGYNPILQMQDKSASINGKPAADLLWYWYPKLLGTK